MRTKLVGVTAIFLLAPFSAALASSFTGITLFGDSLSDNGNAYLLSGGQFPGSNYGSYTFAGGLQTQVYSDGPNTTPVGAGPAGLWVDQLAGKLGVADPLPAAAGGTNYAVASAQSGTANPQDVGNQVALFASQHTSGAPSGALYAFWSGANDILNGGNPLTAADEIESYIKVLHGAGAQTFVWLNLPALGDTPDGQPFKATLNAATAAYNGEYAADLAALQSSGIHVIGVDIGALFSRIVGNPGSFGFSNVTAGARGGSQPTDAGYLFWDGLHPTTAGHAQVADTAFTALTAAATPEPASAALLAVGALGFICVIRRRAARRSAA